MHQMNKFNKSCVALAALTLACGAWAQKAGDNIWGLGIAYVSPDTSVGTITSTYPAFTGALAGATGSISKETTLSFGLLHMYTDNLGVEATIGIPPKHKISLTAGGTAHNDAASVKTWTPTVVGKYFFSTPADQVRPYLGLGVSNVSFHGATLNDASLAAIAGTSISMSSSWAPVYNAGLIYNIDKNWSVNGSISYLPITTKATFVGSGQTTSGDIKINTTDFVVRIGYKF
jgi:outer membrane protein